MQRRVRAAHGFTLIEVLVALIVLVLGVLGAAGMTLTALRDSKQSGTRSQAVALSYELADIMRANITYSASGVAGSGEAVFLAAAPTAIIPACYSSGGCSPAEMAQNEYYLWNTKVIAASGALPGAGQKICRDATNFNSMTTCDGLAGSPMVVKLTWSEKLNDGTFLPSGANAPPRLVIPVQPY